MTPHFTVTLPLLDSTTASPQARESLDKGSRAAGLIPNVYRAMAHAPGMLDTYLLGYEKFRADSGFTPSEQEVVFLTISRENGCEYCVAVHSFIADSRSNVPVEITDAIREGRQPSDPRLATLSSFTAHLMATAGRPDPGEVDNFVSAGFTQEQILQIVLAMAVKMLSNYTNHLFHAPLDPVFESRRWSAGQDA